MSNNNYSYQNNPWPIKAYNNISFLNSPQARIIRILSEMLEPKNRFEKYNIKNTVVFFGSANALAKNLTLKNLKTIENKIKRQKKVNKFWQKKLESAQKDLILSRYYEDAVLLSQKLTTWFKTIKKTHFVICTGGGPGIMEAANLGAKKAHGQSIGLSISLPIQEYINSHITKELSFHFHYFFIRKFWFAYLAKALVIFPGGFGTMDELFELLTLVQTGKSTKPMPVVLYDSLYWKQVINFDMLYKWGTIREKDLTRFKFIDDIDTAFNYLKGELTKYYLK